MTLTFAGGAITEKDWEFLQETLNRYKVRTILEFGAGMSTVLLNAVPGLKVVTYETDQLWRQRVLKQSPKCNIRLWKGKNIRELPDTEVYDLAFVDGPAGGINREISTRAAAEYSNLVVIHDAGREHEKRWQELYLQGKFNGPEKGGTRCHLWLRQS